MIYNLKNNRMTNLILIWVVCSTIITSIVNAIKPWYKKFAWKWTVTISTILAFGLGILCSFSLRPYLWLELNTWLTILVWLALWTWSNIFYDLFELIKARGDKIKSAVPSKN